MNNEEKMVREFFDKLKGPNLNVDREILQLFGLSVIESLKACMTILGKQTLNINDAQMFSTGIAAGVFFHNSVIDKRIAESSPNTDLHIQQLNDKILLDAGELIPVVADIVKEVEEFFEKYKNNTPTKGNNDEK
jgi:hypothetical protein